MSLSQLKKDLKQLSDSERARNLSRFFKTGKGEYGEGDRFLGVRVPDQRKVAREHRDLPLGQVEKLLHSGIHEHRLTALLILVEKFSRASGDSGEEVYEFYLRNTEYVNNWDLVDLSAPKIVGGYLSDRPDERGVLYEFAESDSLWERRIAVLSTFAFIKDGQFQDTLIISRILLDDKQDLIHKAVGWMLREVGKADLAVEEEFLDGHYQTMPRTMLRYAIERFDDEKKRHYMQKPGANR